MNENEKENKHKNLMEKSRAQNNREGEAAMDRCIWEANKGNYPLLFIPLLKLLTLTNLGQTAMYISQIL